MSAIRKRGDGYQVDFYQGSKRRRKQVDTLAQARETEANARLRKRGFAPQVKVVEAITRHRRQTESVDVLRHLDILEEAFSSRQVRDILKTDLEDLLAKFLAEGGRGPCSHNRLLSTTKRLFNLSRKWGFIDVSPAATIERMQEPPGRTRWLTVEEAQRLVRKCEGWTRIAVIWALETGARRSEILGARWRDVRLDAGVWEIPDTKNGEPRRVPLSESMKTLLQTLPRTGERVFGVGSVKKSFRTAVTAAGLTDFRFHDLRHTTASWLCQNSVPLKTVGELLGNPTQVGRYAHIGQSHLHAAVLALPGAFVGIENQRLPVTNQSPENPLEGGGHVEPPEMPGGFANGNPNDPLIKSQMLCQLSYGLPRKSDDPTPPKGGSSTG